jgi:hypothetical protein
MCAYSMPILLHSCSPSLSYSLSLPLSRPLSSFCLPSFLPLSLPHFPFPCLLSLLFPLRHGLLSQRGRKSSIRRRRRCISSRLERYRQPVTRDRSCHIPLLLYFHLQFSPSLSLYRMTYQTISVLTKCSLN